MHQATFVKNQSKTLRLLFTDSLLVCQCHFCSFQGFFGLMTGQGLVCLASRGLLNPVSPVSSVQRTIYASLLWMDVNGRKLGKMEPLTK